MPATSTTGSANVSLLDSNIVASLCEGVFLVDVKSSTYIGDGANNVLGAKVEILNNLGIPVKEFGDDYDIEPPMTSEVAVDIPLQAGNFYSGVYTVTVRLFDGDSTWDVVKKVKICPSNSADKTKKYGILGGKIKGNCKGNPAYVHFLLNNTPAYNGFLSSSQQNNLTLDYPTGSEKFPEDISETNFKALLFEGHYKLHGDVCATYDFGDGVGVDVLYKVNIEKFIRCGLDYNCIYAKLIEINSGLSSNCSDADRANISNVTLEVLLLLTTIEAAVEVGEDPSEYIDSLEALLGCKCTCNCDPTTPYNGSGEPTNNVVIAGCGVEESEDGLTKTYTLPYKNYYVTVNENDNILVAGAVSEAGDDCLRKQTLTFDISAAYTKIKQLANVNLTEANFWASVVNKTLNSVDTACAGIEAGYWQSLTLAQKIAAMFQKMCECCGCDGALDVLNIEADGNDILVFPFFTGDVKWWRVYVDGVFAAELAVDVTKYIAEGVGDGGLHTIKVIPICSNGLEGTSEEKEIQSYGCPDVTEISMNANQVHQVDCPFDLNTLISDLPEPPLGSVVEWYTTSNHQLGSLVVDPSSVGSGIYYGFNKNTDGCFSQGRKATIECNVSTSCSAPQNVQFLPAEGGGGLIRFMSAAYPPPSNSYTVMRRLASDPDELASYTILETPEFNSSLNKWQSKDETSIIGVLYVYKVVSNCTDGDGNPSVDVETANAPCPIINWDEITDTSIQNSFVDIGGDIDTYIMELWDKTKSTKLTEIEVNYPFANPIISLFDDTYIVASTTYFTRLVMKAGTWEKKCEFVEVISEPDAGVNNAQFSRGTGTETICAELPVTLYFTGDEPVPGTVLYTNSGLTSTVDIDFTYILIVDTGKIHTLTSGLIGAEVGECY